MDDVATLPTGTPLEPDVNGTPRYVCACHLVRERPALGRSWVRALWSGFLVPLVGAAAIVFIVAIAVLADPLGAKVVCIALILLLAAGAIAGGRSGGHRGWCATRTAAYWFVAFPAVLLGALSSF